VELICRGRALAAAIRQLSLKMMSMLANLRAARRLTRLSSLLTSFESRWLRPPQLSSGSSHG
jgi:hypothetical protein